MRTVEKLFILVRMLSDAIGRSTGRLVPGLYPEGLLGFSTRMLNIRGENTEYRIVPAGAVSIRGTLLVARVLSEVFGTVPVVEKRIDVWPDMFSEGQKIDADRVLKRLVEQSDGRPVIMLVEEPLWSSEQKVNVYGYGNMEIPVCVVSLSGFFTDGKESWSSFIKVVVHEVGHTFGLRHHGEENIEIPCVMNMTRAVDSRPAIELLQHEFCTSCLGQIVKGKPEGKENTSCVCLGTSST